MVRIPLFFKLSLYALLLFSLLLAGAAGYVWFQLVPQLPSTEALRDVRLQVPLRVYTRDGLLLAEFGEKRRDPIRLEDVPEGLVQAVLAAEDDRFFEHPGVDWQGLLRAAWHLARTGEKGQGGSTITMQVARNFFLGREKTYLRKLNEIMLAIKIERSLSKREILELYLNKIYLGQRSYGVAAAAQIYYGRGLQDLAVAELAMIAGLPKAPSRYNPIADPERAKTRRNYVLRRMYELDFIDAPTYRGSLASPLTAELQGLPVEAQAPYVAEMVRAHMVASYGDQAYTEGYAVYTTLDSRLQGAARRALREGLLAYDRRHGFRGPEEHVELASVTREAGEAALLGGVQTVAGLRPALVTEVAEREAQVVVPGIGPRTIAWEGLEWARRFVTENRLGPKLKTAGDILKPGDVVRVRAVPAKRPQKEPKAEAGKEEATAWELAQLPQVEGALVAVDPQSGAIVALVGGYDYFRSKFNRATQAQRQPGSSFKPFIYSAALAQDFTPASIVNDAPVVFDDPGLEATWRPENYSGKFFGPTRLREALTHSRNLVSIRILRSLGVASAIEYVKRFGFDAERLPRDLSLALGSGSMAPVELARGYAVFANGGYLVEPYFIERIHRSREEVVFQARPARVCPDCEPQGEARQLDSLASLEVGMLPSPDAPAPPPEEALRPAPRVVTAPNAWLMNSLLRDVVRRGTGRRALQLGRKDLAGKTGTTNDQRDAWFAGFQPSLVATVWVGFDKLDPLGSRETGGRAALPIWIDFMRDALEGIPEAALKQPDGLVTVRIDPETGLLAGADHPGALFETFRAERVPTKSVNLGDSARRAGAGGSGTVTEQLF